MKKLKSTINHFKKTKNIRLLSYGKRGIEKEGLRYTLAGKLSEKSHPSYLGLALTNEEITTDYAENLLEVVTPAFYNSKETVEHLCYLHRVLAISDEEYILNASMPGFIDDTESVKVADYGESNSGKLKKLYRKGLALRYGKAMQLISGMHFNYSICDSLFKVYAEYLDKDFNQQFINDKYMNLVRNIRIYSWIIPYLFGHSPAVDKSFFKGKSNHLKELDNETLYLPYATSLRMSDIGYQNKTDQLVSANSLEIYTKDLIKAVTTTSDDYKKYGVKDSTGNFQQLSNNILQIENEYYTVARPKQLLKKGETALSTLNKEGIAYVELRTLDINCFERNGINQEQLDFLEIYMLFCLFTEAPKLDSQMEMECKDNMAKVSCCGRNDNLKIFNNAKETSVKEWGAKVISQMNIIAKAMDIEKHRPHFESILERMNSLIRNPEKTPSAKILKQLKNKSYHKFITEISKNHYEEAKRIGLSNAELNKLKVDVMNSIKKEQQLRNLDEITFDEYLDKYLKEYRDLL